MVIPYISFYGTCSRALDFYTTVFQSQKPKIQLYGSYVPEGIPSIPEGISSWILHAEIDLYGNRFWFADEAEPVRPGNQIKLTLPVPGKKDAQRIFEALSSGGTILLPPTETFYCTFHASFLDRFSVCWNIVAEELPD